jgi:hypothetical protein
LQLQNYNFSGDYKLGRPFLGEERRKNFSRSVVNFYKISKAKWYTKRLLTPNNSAWDDFFSQWEDYWVIVTLKSGRKIAGKYACKSYTSGFPAPKEIYLEEEWMLNKQGLFKKKREQTQGILICENEISTIEFFK